MKNWKEIKDAELARWLKTDKKEIFATWFLNVLETKYNAPEPKDKRRKI